MSVKCYSQLPPCNKVGGGRYLYMFLYNLPEYVWCSSGMKARNLRSQVFVMKGTGI